MVNESTINQTHLQKFQNLLRELFQFDSADLDFGIYRIMNHKRDVIETFIYEALPARMSAELDAGQLAQQSIAASNFEETRGEVLEILGEDAIDADGQLNDRYSESVLGTRYLEQKTAAEAGRSRQVVETDIYNHLFTFFSRYYQDGDFISRRRYSRNQRYAIPYNGEEVYLHWANSDQYYVKTAEHFHNYDWIAPNGVSVRFRLIKANVEQNNVRGDKRFFVPVGEKSDWEADVRAVTVPLEYRPLTVEESRRYGIRNQQEKIIADSVNEISCQMRDVTEAFNALMGDHRPSGNADSVSRLEHHLRQYTRRNNSDFFIHKDLREFLSRELDFYLKNEVLNLDNLEAAGEQTADGWFQQMRLIKSIGNEIIDFIAQIESFQKMLWEKRKFVVETHYCVAVQYVDRDFYPEIVDNDGQWEEWRQLMGIDAAEPSTSFLEQQPTLQIDTRHFNATFTDRLLASFDDLDGMTDGVLIHSENWQALRLIDRTYREAVKCVHIDPPYNTSTSGFLYKNNYRHSSWLAMMRNHIAIAQELLVTEGSFLCHIDENEFERLHLLFEQHISLPNAGTIIWDKRNPMTAGRGVANQHEYVIWRSGTDKSINLRNKTILNMLNKAAELIKAKGAVDETVKNEYAKWVRRHTDLTGGEKAYRFLDDDGRIYRGVSLRAPEPRTDPKFFRPLMHPVTGKPCAVPPNGFSRTPETFQRMIENGEIIFGTDEGTQPQQKRLLTTGSTRQLSSVMQNAKRGKADLDALGLATFPYSHSVYLYEELLGAASDSPTDVILDYFAGSGTTGHAVINLNREDGGRRKFIMVEMGEYFDAVLLNRIKKVTFSPAWKDGTPERAATLEEVERSPRIIKYVRLESYEDALDGIGFEEEAGRLNLQDSIDGYLLQYMLKWETKQSQTLLNAGKLTRPFDYRLRVYTQGEERERTADVAETFNYLLGLNVRTRQVYEDDGRRYLVYRGETRESPGRGVAVIWRDTEGWTEEDFARDREFVKEAKLDGWADTVYVNGNSVIPGATSIEPLFKARMFAGVSD